MAQYPSGANACVLAVEQVDASLDPRCLVTVHALNIARRSAAQVLDDLRLAFAEASDIPHLDLGTQA